ncbi:uncharacterized protein LOC111069179 [Drosophila obscura]|uniref:uncharacterized protein LOC111069179 n=1 Tax=Drosophila obscura TaxID=7282 RepID=UPI001BB2B16D|nr:uncharacterized protein LOC111069179 [Drosophila obscura]
MMNRSLAMLEGRLRSQRLEPAVSRPTRTTTLRRQVCVNIEANGSSPCMRQRRRRKRELQMPYPYPYPPILMPMDDFESQTKRDLHCGYPVTGGFLFQHPHWEQYPMERTKSGQEYAMYAPTLERNNLARSLYTNVNSTGSMDELKGIASTLENSLHNFLTNAETIESEPVHDGSSAPEESTRSRNYVSIGPQESKTQQLTDLMCDTIHRLNSFICSQTQIGEPQPTYNFGLGPEGLKSHSHLLHPSIMMMVPAKSSHPIQPPVESTEASTQTRSSVVRTPWLRERRRKRLVRPTYIQLKNRGCSTEDLAMWPRILDAISNINSRENHLQTQPSRKSMRDSGTTMWCPMECCRGYCGCAQLGQICHKSNEENGANLPPPLPTTPPPALPAQDEHDYEVASKCLYIANADSQSTIGSSIVSSSYTSDSRSEGGMQKTQLSVSYIEEEEQREEHPKRADKLDDWYKSASKSLAELEQEQECYKAIEEQRSAQSTRNKRLQTEPVSSSASSEVNIRVTADMAVSTSDLNACRLQQPIKPALKSERAKSGQEIMKPAPGAFGQLSKVKFEEKVPHNWENIMAKPSTRAVRSTVVQQTPKGFEIKTRFLKETPTPRVPSTRPPRPCPLIKRKYLQDVPTKKKRITKKFDCSPLIGPPSNIRKSPPAYPSEWLLD